MKFDLLGIQVDVHLKQEVSLGLTTCRSLAVLEVDIQISLNGLNLSFNMFLSGWQSLTVRLDGVRHSVRRRTFDHIILWLCQFIALRLLTYKFLCFVVLWGILFVISLRELATSLTGDATFVTWALYVADIRRAGLIEPAAHRVAWIHMCGWRFLHYISLETLLLQLLI